VHVLLDACVALNLEATGEFDAIADTLGITFAMSPKAVEETLFLVDIIDGEKTHTQVDLNVHVEKRTLEIVAPAVGDELATFVTLTQRVDDGEAEVFALGLHRGLPVATDDRLAIRVATELGLDKPAGTPTFLKQYAEAASLRPDQINMLLMAVETRASFRPPHSSPEHSWWLGHRSAPND
jgi:predicted nucleic acid-binding protein